MPAVSRSRILATAGCALGAWVVALCFLNRPSDPAATPAVQPTVQAEHTAASPTDPRVKLLSAKQLPTVDGPRVSDRFPNIELMDQHGRTLHFYDDIVKDRCVCLVFFYTRCTGSCPSTTVTLKAIRKAISEEFPDDEMKFVSLTLEPFVDTPEELQAYMDRYHITEDASLPEWIYATGDYEEIDNLRRTLGLYELDPVLDADKTQHASLVTFGNDRLNRWAALPADMNRENLINTLIRIAGNSQRQRYARTLTSTVDQSSQN